MHSLRASHSQEKQARGKEGNSQEAKEDSMNSHKDPSTAQDRKCIHACKKNRALLPTLKHLCYSPVGYPIPTCKPTVRFHEAAAPQLLRAVRDSRSVLCSQHVQSGIQTCHPPQDLASVASQGQDQGTLEAWRLQQANLCRHQPVEQNAFVVRSLVFEAATLKRLVVTAERS